MQIAKKISMKDLKLKFDQSAWDKLCYLRDKGQTEVGGFAVSHDNDLLHVREIHLVLQKTTSVTVKFEDEGVADFTENMFEDGIHPRQCLRIWWHTHPGHSATPSFVDEETFEKVFGKCNWSIMFILAKGGEHYARLQLRGDIEGSVILPVQVQRDVYYDPEWGKEYDSFVTPIKEKKYEPVSKTEGLNPVFGTEELSDDGDWDWSDRETDRVAAISDWDLEFNIDRL